MPTPVTGLDNVVGAWVSREVGKLWYPGKGRAIGWADAEGKLLGGVTFFEFDGVNVWLDAAGIPKSGWLTRAGLKQIFDYVFVQLQCVRASLMVPANNAASLKMVKQIGFVQEAVLERAAPEGQDMLVFRMFREDCKWIPNDARP